MAKIYVSVSLPKLLKHNLLCGVFLIQHSRLLFNYFVSLNVKSKKEKMVYNKCQISEFEQWPIL